MKILILGGTRFLGRALAEAAIERGDTVTLFHRGQTGPDLFAGVEHILGDRERDLDRLGTRNWDAVFDTCGFFPRIVRISSERLAPHTGHYSFVSSVSVYREPLAPGADEAAAVGTLADETIEEINGETYGPLKALCEREVERALPRDYVNVRAGLLVGPHDYTDRFPYWVTRLAEGGEVLIPDAPSQPLQLIDARDVASWMLRLAADRGSGTFNVTGPAQPLTLGAFLAASRDVLGADARFVPVDVAFLKQREVGAWFELPLWTGDGAELLTVRIDRALANGLSLRPLDQTLIDTLLWARGPRAAAASSLTGPPPASLTREREAQLLREWASRPGGGDSRPQVSDSA
jgi:2'-hydroxyisoflavone reductase